jgi:hypothetical protein
MHCIGAGGRYEIEQRYKVTDTNLPRLYWLDFEVEGDEGEDEALDMWPNVVRGSLRSVRMD